MNPFPTRWGTGHRKAVILGRSRWFVVRVVDVFRSEGAEWSAQGRAERPPPRSAAPGLGTGSPIAALKGRNSHPRCSLAPGARGAFSQGVPIAALVFELFALRVAERFGRRFFRGRKWGRIGDDPSDADQQGSDRLSSFNDS